MKQILVRKLIKRKFVRSAIRDKADLSAFHEPPTFRIFFGVFLIILSYILSWPAISFLGFLATIHLQPLLVIIGGPIMYGLSHLVFLTGMYLSGAKYSIIFLRWATRKLMQKLLTPLELYQLEQQISIANIENLEEK